MQTGVLCKHDVLQFSRKQYIIYLEFKVYINTTSIQKTGLNQKLFYYLLLYSLSFTKSLLTTFFYYLSQFMSIRHICQRTQVTNSNKTPQENIWAICKLDRTKRLSQTHERTTVKVYDLQFGINALAL